MLVIPFDNTLIGLASGIIASIPDIVGEYKARDIDIKLWKFHYKRKGDNWKFYNDVHNFKHWLSFIPPITLHILLDKLGHGTGKRWYAGKWWEYLIPWRYKEAMWLQTITWIINIIIIWRLYA